MSTQHTNNDQDVSVKEVILTLKDYLSAMWRSKFLIVFVTGLCVVLFVLTALFTRPTFPGELTFMINEEDGGGAGLSSILGDFGLGGGSEYNLDKILQLSKSRKVAQHMLFDSISVNNKSDYLANHTIDYLESEEEWGEINLIAKLLYGGDPMPIKGFRFTNSDVSSFGTLENKALKVLHIMIAGTPDGSKEGIVTTEQSEDTGIMSLISTTHRPELSAQISSKLYEKLSTYYVEKSIEKHKTTFEIVQEKSDSIASALSIAQANLANFKDKNQGIFRNKDKLYEQKLIANIQKLIAIDEEVEKNLQIADFTLKNKTPYIEVIDEPMLPLLPNRPSIIQQIIKGLLLGLILSIGFVVLRKFWRDTMV